MKSILEGYLLKSSIRNNQTTIIAFSFLINNVVDK